MSQQCDSMTGCLRLTNNRINFCLCLLALEFKEQCRTDDSCFMFIRLSKKVHPGVVSIMVMGHTVEAAEQMT